MPIHYVTYVTHKEGHFDELVNNKYGLKIDVIGWGKKWNGLMDKMGGYYDYCKQFPEGDVIVFLDGFDTIIDKDPSRVLSLFESLNCDILVSNGDGGYWHTDYFIKRVFGSCRDGNTANSGLMMGYVKHLKPMFEYALNTKSIDDQVGFNQYCRNKPNVNLKIDNDMVIFENQSKRVPGTGIFISFPGGYGNLSLKYKLRRMYRAIFCDYPRFFIPEIILFFILLYLIIKKIYATFN